MLYPETKAYLLFYRYILNIYNDALFTKITYFEPEKICEEKDNSVILSLSEDIREVATALNTEIDDVALKEE